MSKHHFHLDPVQNLPPEGKRRLLVVGGAGFIGSCFVEMAVQLGHQVTVLDALTYAGHRENLEGIQGPGHWQLVVGDIRHFETVWNVLQSAAFDAVVNFAAESHVDRSIQGPAPFIETNICGTFNLLQACHQYWKSLDPDKNQSFRYLQVSTDEVFGSLGPLGKFSETTPYAPNSPYSASKASGDHLVRAWYHTYGLPTLITNCSNNYGPRQFPEKLIPTMIIHALEGKPLPIYGDGQNIRDWIHVADHCRGLMLALTNGKPGGTYCFGGNAERDNLQVVQTLCRELDRMKPRVDGQPHASAIQFIEDRLGHDRRYAIDDSLAVRELGFHREFSFEQGLALTVQWYLDNRNWSQAVMRK
jgi:dTDP-glucose 4,6-dehydratase